MLKTIKKYETCVFIGRFQPIHMGHVKTIKTALSCATQLIIVMGSYRAARTTRNPWSAQERVRMIKSILTQQEVRRVHFVFVRDRIYNETLWKSNVLNEVLKLTQNNSSTAIIGYEKDVSSYYLKNFPQWEFLKMDFYKNLNSTDFRNHYFLSQKVNYDNIPSAVKKFLLQYKRGKSFQQLRQEFEYEKSTLALNQKDRTQNCCLVLCSNYILLEKRKNYPGKNLVSLPQKDDLSHIVPNAIGKSYFVSERTFECSEKNPIKGHNTLVFFYKVSTIECPKIEKDRNLLFEWVLLDDLQSLEDKFYSDHYQIINCTITSNQT